MSWTAAPAPLVTMAIRWGYGGRGFLWAGSNSPSCWSFCFSCSKATYRSPTPSGDSWVQYS